LLLRVEHLKRVDKLNQLRHQQELGQLYGLMV
jgi:hypothetical protein